MCNQNQSISISVICRQNTKAIALLFAKIGSLSTLFNLQSTSINFNLGHLSPKYQGYSLTFCPNWLIFITFQCAIKSINFNLGYFSPKYQGYSLTICPTLAHFHHFSMCNQNQSISICVMCRQNTKAIALLFAQNWLIVNTFQSAININQFQFGSFVAKIPRL